ncbi:outer membrane beta-barrel protein [Lysobacter soli]|uniref:OmpW/AlkL family protein n=1 Tax=Lysobacter soli TaxID=453783 RepID=UPI0020A1AA07|nr:OmpW family outer membrane protein [Lysobacter soli]MDG2519416.1 OmpW family outer membrane protein [Lysobacter soli]UTA55071.1 outer membrane beta-barrel protein [Lysobacter soli]
MKHFRQLTLAVVATLAIAPAFAQEIAGPDTSGKKFAVVGGYTLAEPTKNPMIAGERTNVDGDGAATLSANYYITDNIAIEAWGAADKFGNRVRTPNGKVASVDTQPYALSGQYHFGNTQSIVRPFVGLGYFEANTDGEKAEPTGPLAGQHIGVETAKGAIATAGVDVNITPTWFARADVRYMHDTTGQPNVTVDGANVGKAELNPVTVGVGLGARF